MKYYIVLGAIVFMGLFASSPIAGALTLSPACKDIGAECAVTEEDRFTNATATKNIINTIIYVAGALSVILIIVGGIRYVISQGDAKQIESAKNTILYSVIGLIVTLLAYAIVQFVVNTFK